MRIGWDNFVIQSKNVCTEKKEKLISLRLEYKPIHVRKKKTLPQNKDENLSSIDERILISLIEVHFN